MNGPLFSNLAIKFDGVASIGDYDSTDGVVTVWVHPAPGDVIPSLDKLNRAYAIGDTVEDLMGITVIVKAAEPAITKG